MTEQRAIIEIFIQTDNFVVVFDVLGKLVDERDNDVESSLINIERKVSAGGYSLIFETDNVDLFLARRAWLPESGDYPNVRFTRLNPPQPR